MKNTTQTQTTHQVNYADLINRAVTEPATLSDCYKLFHDYSLLNSLYIIRQLQRKQLPVEPVKGYKAWSKLNRQVKANLLTNKTNYGFKNGIEVLFPIMGYIPVKDENGNIKKDEKGKTIFKTYVKKFNYAKWHFSASQTELIDNTKPIETLSENSFKIDLHDLCKKLDIEIIEYNDINGNCQGYAKPELRQLAINPIAENTPKTCMHEIAHIILEHHNKNYDLYIKEVEAECVAYIVLSVCNNNYDLSHQRAYIQHWLGENELTDDIAKRIIHGASEILNTLK